MHEGPGFQPDQKPDCSGLQLMMAVANKLDSFIVCSERGGSLSVSDVQSRQTGLTSSAGLG